MEILQHTLKDIEIKLLTNFELKVWNILCSLFKDIISDKLSDKSSIEKGLGIDVFLRLKEGDFVLYISITDDRLYINSKYFDIYIYPETTIDKIETLLRDVLLGKYMIELGYGNKDKLVYKKFIFDNKEMVKFNEVGKIGLSTKQIKNRELVKGFKFITD